MSKGGITVNLATSQYGRPQDGWINKHMQKHFFKNKTVMWLITIKGVHLYFEQ